MKSIQAYNGRIIMKVALLAAILALAMPAAAKRNRGNSQDDNGGGRGGGNENAASSEAAPAPEQKGGQRQGGMHNAEAAQPAAPSAAVVHANPAGKVSRGAGRDHSNRKVTSIHLGSRPMQDNQAPDSVTRQRESAGRSRDYGNEKPVHVERVQPESRFRGSESRPRAVFQAQGGEDVHHHYAEPTRADRDRLKKMGIKRIPQAIGERAEILDTDRSHSVLRFPEHGFDNKPLHHKVIEARAFNDPIVRLQMNAVVRAPFLKEITVLDRTEREPGRFYWHHGGGFDYCRHVDNWGYAWYGWYLGDRFFWTRHFGDRFWFYDTAFDRWCFWNDGGWWWQDPYHVGDLYVYTGTGYMPVADENRVVTAQEPPTSTAFRSPDDQRLVKLMPGTADAFLYDTAIPPSFSPVYLASKVKSVKFSDTAGGAPLQIMLTLEDGTVDQFDADGRPLNFREAVPQGDRP